MYFWISIVEKEVLNLHVIGIDNGALFKHLLEDVLVFFNDIS